MDVFISHTSWEASLGMANRGLTLVCRDVIACVIHGLEKGGLFVRAPIFLYLFLFHQVGKLRTSYHLQLQPGQDKAKKFDTYNNTELHME